MMMVLCGSWIWQQYSGVSVVLVLTAVCVVSVANNGRGWWLCSDGGCQCGGCGCCGLLAKKRERRIIIILYGLSYYPMLSQNKSKCATATVLCVLQKTITYTLVHLICFL